ncbi:hypothetical protein L249_0247 [Ophiocordyceps polyrhachis-furcata BCC 54312]|uniref:Uncharacterized protein n=1 Tax=Ophiocordyceps polyrhachis-furcata BCC 54312 TaxID=1330021 RepID=A0A367LCL2_9HYPO|nr:hypothetical protein L249_0247 [Ophiocordyceps polyrhachis-furcata BCC 54312]
MGGMGGGGDFEAKDEAEGPVLLATTMMLQRRLTLLVGDLSVAACWEYCCLLSAKCRFPWVQNDW